MQYHLWLICVCTGVHLLLIKTVIYVKTIYLLPREPFQYKDAVSPLQESITVDMSPYYDKSISWVGIPTKVKQQASLHWNRALGPDLI